MHIHSLPLHTHNTDTLKMDKNLPAPINFGPTNPWMDFIVTITSHSSSFSQLDSMSLWFLSQPAQQAFPILLFWVTQTGNLGDRTCSGTATRVPP